MKRNTGLWILTAAAVLWLGFIWGHSLVPAELSQEESGAVLETLRRLLHAEWLTDHLVRKAAHFTEYLILGLLCTGTLRGWAGRKGLAALPAAGLLAPLVDETIQLFVPGRSGQITDVWLDAAGFAAGALFLTAVRLFFRRGGAGKSGNDFIKPK